MSSRRNKNTPTNAAASNEQTPVTPNASQQTPTNRPSAILQPSSTKRRKLDMSRISTVATTSSFQAGTTSSTNKAWITKVYPCSNNDPDMQDISLPFSGFTITPSVPFGDRLISDIFYKPAAHAGKIQFLTTNEKIVTRVLTVKDPLSGNKRQYQSKKNQKFYPWNSFAYITENEDVLTDDNIQIYLGQKFVQAVKDFYTAYPHENKYKTSFGTLPEMGNMQDHAHVQQVYEWGSVIDDPMDVVYCINKALADYCADESVKLDFKTWCQYDKKHIYTCWKKGSIPRDVITKYALDEKCMFADDWKLYLTQQQELADKSQTLLNFPKKSDGSDGKFGVL
jgi:hypothetical protein